MFNLEEEEEGLTHYGQSLGDMKHFNELQLSSGEEEGEGKPLRDWVLIDDDSSLVSAQWMRQRLTSEGSFARSKMKEKKRMKRMQLK